MAEGDGSLDQLLFSIRFILDAPFDFTATDNRSLLTKVRLLAASAKYFNGLAVSLFGGRLGSVREEGLVEQVVGAAFQTFDGVDPHPTPFEKAAMLLRGITQGHPFTDGNKRTGFLLAAYFLRQTGIPLPDPLNVALAESLCLRVSAGEIRDINVIAAELRALWRDFN